MSNYQQVQFISWELHTGPVVASQAAGRLAGYAGLHDTGPDQRTDALAQCRDIEARLAFVADAVASARALATPDPSTLKIFMAPEFLLRGAGGAYLHDLLGGWEREAPRELLLPAPYAGPWPGLFGGLRAIAADARHADWLFVFGTAVSASFPHAERDGKYVLDPKGIADIYNTALIQRGGAGHGEDAYVSRKHYKSPIDFLAWNAQAGVHVDGRVKPLEPRSVIPADVLGVTEGGAVFRIAGLNDGGGAPIDFGIEICLDHAESGADANPFGRIRTAGQFVRIQLVPSGGMWLVPESVRLVPRGPGVAGAYAFNCDGLASLDAGRHGSHAQVWSNGVAPQQLDADGGAPLAGTRVAGVAAALQVGAQRIAADQLWNNGDGVAGAGQVRVFAPRPL